MRVALKSFLSILFKNKLLGCGLSFIAAVLILVPCVILWPRHKQTLRLLDGSSRVRVVSFRIGGTESEVICTDPSTCDYLAQVIRTARQPNEDIGTAFDLGLTFGNGCTEDLSFEVLAHNRGATIAGSFSPSKWGDFDYYSVSFPQPVPDRFAEILAYLRLDRGSAAGWTLVVDGNGVRKVRRPDLKSP